MPSFELWHPIPDVPAFLSGALVLQPGNELLVICYGEFQEDNRQEDKRLVLSFGGVEAFYVFEEMEHRWPLESSLEPPPRSPGSSYAFPFLKIVDSPWIADSRRAEAFEVVLTHYRVISLSYVVDILTERPPQVRWAKPEEIDFLFDRTLQIGRA